jgi:hypothetical protein
MGKCTAGLPKSPLQQPQNYEKSCMGTQPEPRPPTSNGDERTLHLSPKPANLGSAIIFVCKLGQTGWGEDSFAMNFGKKYACFKTPKLFLRATATALLFWTLAAAPATTSAQYLGALPRSLAGTWRITRVLPTTNSSCWTRQQAQSLLGTTLTYRTKSLRWHDGQIPVTDVSLRDLTDKEFRQENPGPNSPANFAQIGIHAGRVTEVDMQHEDSDVLPASTAVPGDSVLLAAPNRIVVSACGIYFEATRAGSGTVTRTSGK